MSGELNNAQVFFDEFFKVVGDGLGEGQIVCEAELEDSYWLFDLYLDTPEAAKDGA